MDALLGAAGLGDAGRHFPEEAVPEGASSLELLVQTSKLVVAAGYRIVNVDCTVAIQDIVVGSHSELMKSRIAAAIGIDAADVNVGATTTDRLGFVGKGEGAAAMAVALIEREG
jgi:2-C-methyl-D-erythritol 2,4-cyclodiphosphate synthase